MRAGPPGAAEGGEGRRPTPHRVVNPEGLAPPVGFAHAVVAAPGRTVWLGGQAAQGPDGTIRGLTLAEQFDVAAGNLVAALAAAGGAPEHLVSLQVYTTEIDVYRATRAQLGAVYRRHLGRHYVATALFEVAGLFDPVAKVELVGIAVVPDPDPREQP
jgi:enamine deaminase RidA (YjgF/YER057c/UK114 family)